MRGGPPLICGLCDHPPAVLSPIGVKNLTWFSTFLRGVINWRAGKDRYPSPLCTESNLRPVKFGERETGESLIEATGHIIEKGDGDRFAEANRVDGIRTPVDTTNIASKRVVGREFVEFPANGE